MLRTTVAFLKPKVLPGFCVFASLAWKQPKVLAAPSFRARSAIVIAAWRKLTSAQQEKYNTVGKRTPLSTKPKPPARISPWHRYVRANYAKVKRLPFEKRLSALAASWRAKNKNKK
jgi:hypothetical protein